MASVQVLSGGWQEPGGAGFVGGDVSRANREGWDLYRISAPEEVAGHFLIVDRGQLIVDRGQLIVDRGQLTVDRGEWLVILGDFVKLC